MDNKKIGDYISFLRKQKNLTQKDLADLLGITDKAVSKWERGVGYPDISSLRPLADILGTTVTELLDGENSLKNTEGISEEVNSALDYADQIITLKKHKYGKIAATLLSISLLLAIFICVIVNIAVSHNITWSLLVASSCILSGCILIPPLIMNKKGMIISLSLLTLLIIPFLISIEYIIENELPSSGWALRIGTPIVLIWLFLLWIMVILYRKSHLNIWFLLSIGLLLCIPSLLFTNHIVDVFTDHVIDMVSRKIDDISSVFCMVTTAGICFVIGLTIRKKSPKE